ncbi:hypothetical protein HN51_034362 [Arachis hypogaea]
MIGAVLVPEGSEGSDSDLSIVLDVTWALNLIEKAILECFNMPSYDPSMEEVKQIIKEEGSFVVHKLKTIQHEWRC